jgi:hypothetical protein
MSGTLRSNQTMKLTATALRFADGLLLTSFLSPRLHVSPRGRSLSFSR